MHTAILIVLASCLMVADDAATLYIAPDFLMDADPKITAIPSVVEFKVDYAGVWLKALERPDCDMQRMAAETIAIGQTKGVPNLKSTIPALEKILATDSTHSVARYAAARALMVLDSKDSAEKLFQASNREGGELGQLVEPVLAEWGYAPIRKVWIERLESPAARPRELILACRGIGRTGEASALPALVKICLDPSRTGELRMEAASAAGLLAETGLEIHAERLIREPRSSRLINRHCAVNLLARHQSDVARKILVDLATDEESTVAAQALRRLNQIDSNLVISLADQVSKSSDMRVREQLVAAYFNSPNSDRMMGLATLMDDEHPTVRQTACLRLLQLSKTPELTDSVINAAMVVMEGKSWRGQEQAALLIGQLEYRPAWMRLCELLESSQAEVAIASAWSLRKLADERSIPAIIAQIRRQKAFVQEAAAKRTFVQDPKISRLIDNQVTHLFEACGRMRVMDARGLMIECVPKNSSINGFPRAAAIWSLGYLHEGKNDPSLAKALMERFMDVGSIPPELPFIRNMCVVSMGRMKATDYTDQLRSIAAKNPADLHLRWAVMQLTGELLPLPAADVTTIGPTFLDPLEPAVPASRQ